MVCVELDAIDCCDFVDLGAMINVYCAPDGSITVGLEGGIAPYTVFGANLADTDISILFEESDLDVGTYDLSNTPVWIFTSFVDLIQLISKFGLNAILYLYY